MLYPQLALWATNIGACFAGSMRLTLQLPFGIESLHTRIYSHHERLGVALAADRQFHRVSCGKHRRTATTEEVGSDGGRTAAAFSGRGGTEVPNPSMHSRKVRERFGLPHPEDGNAELVRIYR